MTNHRIAITEDKMDAALSMAKRHDTDPVAQTVEYLRDRNILLITLSNGRRLPIPLEELQGLADATPNEIENHELLGGGTGISFPALDVDLYIPALIEGVYGNRRWMAELAKPWRRSKNFSKAPRLPNQRGEGQWAQI